MIWIARVALGKCQLLAAANNGDRDHWKRLQGGQTWLGWMLAAANNSRTGQTKGLETGRQGEAGDRVI